MTRQEREHILRLVGDRIVKKKPVSYLVKGCYQQGEFFYIDERVLVPRSHLGEIIRNYKSYSEPDEIRSDMDYEDYFPNSKDASSLSLMVREGNVKRVLDLCTGSGCLAVLCCQWFEKVLVDAVDISPDALDVARINVTRKCLQDVIQLHLGDLFDALPMNKDGTLSKFDLIVSNPPYVDDLRMQNLPAE